MDETSKKMIPELEGRAISHAFLDTDATGAPVIRIHLMDGGIVDIYAEARIGCNPEDPPIRLSYACIMFDVAYTLEQMNKIPKPSPRVVACIEKLEDYLCVYVESFEQGQFVRRDPALTSTK